MINWRCPKCRVILENKPVECPVCDRDLTPPLALAEIKKVLEFGAEKHSPHGWKTDNTTDGDFEAHTRHEEAWEEGRDNDRESNLHPLAHAIARMMFILDRELAE